MFFATAFGGFRIGIATALVGGLLGVTVNFSDATADSARFVLLMIFLGGVRPDDLGRRALSVDRRDSSGRLQSA